MGMQTLGVLALPFSLSSGAICPEVYGSMSCVHPNLGVVVFFENPSFGSFNISTPGFIWSIFSWS